MTSLDEEVLVKLRFALDEIYGTRIDRIVLFGSRARGTAERDSDYDVAIFLKTLPDRWAEIHRLADLRVRFIDESQAFLDLLPYQASAYLETSPLMREIRIDGRDL